MSRQDKGFYEFDQYRLDPVKRVLQRGEETIPLTPKAISTLLALVERRGELVEKDALIQTIWPDTFITEATLTQNIFRLRKALGEGAGDHRYIVTVPGRGYSFVADVRRIEPEPDPDSLPPHAEATSESILEPPAGAPAARASQTAPTVRHHGWWAAGLALGLIVLTLGLLMLRAGPRHDTAPEAAAARPPRRSVAVLGFRNLSGRPDTAWLSTALAEMFTVELGVGDKLKTISGETVARTRIDLDLNDLDNLSAATLSRIRSMLGCDVLLVGSYLDLGGQGGKVRIDLRLLDTATGETLAVRTRTRMEAELFELVSDLGRDLRQDLGGGASQELAVAARASFPAGREARRLYSEGLEHLHTLDFLKARDLLRQATAAEPGFPLAHASLAVAWSNLGYDSKAEEESAQALALSATLPEEDRLLVEGLHEESRKDWNRAVEIYDRLRSSFPDDPEHGLRLARAQIAAGKAHDALATLAALRRLPSPLSDDPRIDLTEAEAAAALSDLHLEETMAGRAVARGEELGARLLMARALQILSRAQRLLGKPAEALASIQKAGRIFEEAGDRSGIADARFDTAIVLTAQGDLAGARRLCERALEVYEETGNQRGRLRVKRQLGNLAVQLGDIARAKQYLTDAVGIADEINDRLERNQALMTLAILQQSEGELSAAVQSLTDALASFHSLGSIELEGAVHVNLANVLRDRGDLPAARDHAETGLRLLRQIGHSRGTGFALNQLGLLLIDQGDLEGARGAYRELDALAKTAGFKGFQADAAAGSGLILELQDNLAAARTRLAEALALREEGKRPYDVADSRLALAQLALEEGDAAVAEREARKAADELRSLHAKGSEAQARATLARALAAQGQSAAAEQALRAALELTAKSENRRARLAVLIAAGQIDGDAGRVGEGLRTLTEAREEAGAKGLSLHRLDASLALGRLELRRGDARVGRLLLQALAREASRKGFKLAARRAEELASPPAPVPSLPRPPVPPPVPTVRVPPSAGW